MTETGPVVALSTKVPRPLRDAFVELARRRGVTPSALLRHLIDLELSGAPDGTEAGEVEQAVRDELAERQVDLASARAAAAVNLARRMDRDPTSGAANAGQLRRLLDALVPTDVAGSFDALNWIRFRAALKLRGWRLVDRAGEAVEMSDADREAIIAAVSG